MKMMPVGCLSSVFAQTHLHDGSIRIKVANTAGFGRHVKSPCFPEGAQAIEF
jgi:hypothetical protein